jgi:G3E family GTPase
MMALNMLSELEPPPEHILIEASGVADPYNLSQYGYTGRLQRNGVIVVADAETVQTKSVDKYVGDTVKRQLQGADLILLNKIDLVDAEALKDVRTWLHGLVPDARVVEAAHGIVPLPILLGVSRTGGPPTGRCPATASPKHHHPTDEYDTWSFASEQPLDGEAFRSMVEVLPEGIIRAKGILYLQENPKQRHMFQLVGKRWSLKPGGDWGDAQPTSRLVMIGLLGSIDADWLERLIMPSKDSQSSSNGLL